MLLLGERNWCTPRGLSRLPSLEHEEPAGPVRDTVRV